MDGFQLIPFDEKQHFDLVEPLTNLLHRAYAPLAAKGLKYVATHQPPTRTLKRLKDGFGFLVFANTQLIGTVTLYPPKSQDVSQHYMKTKVYSFGQFAIDPQFQKSGLGSKVMAFLEDEARRRGAEELALDTSIHADHLISLYQRRGYKVVEEVQWSETNYRSFIMSLVL